MKTKVTINGVEYNLDLEKAKELGVLKEEDTRCKSWEEFCVKYRDEHGFYYDEVNENILLVDYPCATNEQLTEEESIAISAFSKLLKLRRDWIGTWKPNWCDVENKYCIVVRETHIIVKYFYAIQHPFSFPTEEMAREFLECFKHLFEDCKFLI
jgi:HEPN domain-containing protein